MSKNIKEKKKNHCHLNRSRRCVNGFMILRRLDGRFYYPGRKNRVSPKLRESKSTVSNFLYSEYIFVKCTMKLQPNSGNLNWEINRMIESCLFSSRRTWHCLVKIFAENIKIESSTIGKCCRFFFLFGWCFEGDESNRNMVVILQMLPDKGWFYFFEKRGLFLKTNPIFFLAGKTSNP